MRLSSVFIPFCTHATLCWVQIRGGVDDAKREHQSEWPVVDFDGAGMGCDTQLRQVRTPDINRIFKSLIESDGKRFEGKAFTTTSKIF